MIRLIVRSDDANMAANVGGSVHTNYRTFDVDLPEVEKALREGNNAYVETQVVGAELISVPLDRGNK